MSTTRDRFYVREAAQMTRYAYAVVDRANGRVLEHYDTAAAARDDAAIRNGASVTAGRVDA